MGFPLQVDTGRKTILWLTQAKVDIQSEWSYLGDIVDVAEGNIVNNNIYIRGGKILQVFDWPSILCSTVMMMN